MKLKSNTCVVYGYTVGYVEGLKSEVRNLKTRLEDTERMGDAIARAIDNGETPTNLGVLVRNWFQMRKNRGGQ